MAHHDLIIKNADICTMDANMTRIQHGYVVVDGETITSVNEGSVPAGVEADTVIDAEGQVLFPGFIDTHTHIFQSFLKGLGADHRLIEWLNRSALPYGKYMTPYQHRLAAQLTCMEAIKSGCTTLCEFFYTDQDPELADGCIAGMEDTGIRSVFIRTFQDCGEDYGMPACFIQPADKAMEEVSRLRHDYADRSDMLSIWTGPDVTWSTTKEGYRTMLDYCKSENVRYAMHIDETEVDDDMCQKHYGQDIVPMLDDMGFLTDHMLGVHCVNLTPDEIKRFADNGVSISYNPVSNMYLGSGAAPIREALDAGVNVSIGTDGAASNNTTNYLESIKFAALVQKGFTRDAARITAPQTIRMANGSFGYTAFAADVYARRIVGWACATTMNTQELPLQALEQAVSWAASHGGTDGLIHHSDHGTQYTGTVYTTRVMEYGMLPSTGTVGDSYDNAMAESADGAYKTELVWRRKPFADLKDLELATFRWVSWRGLEAPAPVRSLGYRTPEAVETEYYQHQAAQAASL